MSPARILHFGTDDCARVLVLSRCGYKVDACDASIAKLRTALSRGSIDAVLVSEEAFCRQPAVLTVVRSLTSAPIVLFESMEGTDDSSRFDLIIPMGTHPADWLDGLAEIIQRGRVAGRNSPAQPEHGDSAACGEPPKRSSSPKSHEKARAEAAGGDKL